MMLMKLIFMFSNFKIPIYIIFLKLINIGLQIFLINKTEYIHIH